MLSTQAAISHATYDRAGGGPARQEKLTSEGLCNAVCAREGQPHKAEDHAVCPHYAACRL